MAFNKLKKIAKKVEHKVVKPLIRVHAKVLGPIVTGTTDYAKQKKRFRAGAMVGAAVATVGAAAVAKTVGSAVVGSITRRSNPQPQSSDDEFHPADTMVETPANPTRQIYGADPQRPKGILEKFIGALWRIVVPTPR